MIFLLEPGSLTNDFIFFLCAFLSKNNFFFHAGRLISFVFRVSCSYYLSRARDSSSIFLCFGPSWFPAARPVNVRGVVGARIEKSVPISLPPFIAIITIIMFIIAASVERKRFFFLLFWNRTEPGVFHYEVFSRKF